jgi:hypothetical protein
VTRLLLGAALLGGCTVEEFVFSPDESACLTTTTAPGDTADEFCADGGCEPSPPLRADAPPQQRPENHDATHPKHPQGHPRRPAAPVPRDSLSAEQADGQRLRRR